LASHTQQKNWTEYIPRDYVSFITLRGANATGQNATKSWERYVPTKYQPMVEKAMKKQQEKQNETKKRLESKKSKTNETATHAHESANYSELQKLARDVRAPAIQLSAQRLDDVNADNKTLKGFETRALKVVTRTKPEEHPSSSSSVREIAKAAAKERVAYKEATWKADPMQEDGDVDNTDEDNSDHMVNERLNAKEAEVVKPAKQTLTHLSARPDNETTLLDGVGNDTTATKADRVQPPKRFSWPFVALSASVQDSATSLATMIFVALFVTALATSKAGRRVSVFEEPLLA